MKNNYLLKYILFVGVVLSLGVGKDLMKVVIVSWDAAPEPTIFSISQEPNDAIMMGGRELMDLEVAGPEDLDTKTETDTESGCNPKTTYEQDNISPSEWWILYNPGQFLQTSALYNRTAPIRWNWRDGIGDYGSSAAMCGFYKVWDGRMSDDPRYDNKNFGTSVTTYKTIPDRIDTQLRLDHPEDPAGTGCMIQGGNHIGAYFYHPIYNTSYPTSFAGLVVKEKFVHVATDAIYDPNDPDDPVQRRIDSILSEIDFSGEVDEQGRIDDGHGAGLPLEVFFNNEATYVTYYQEWQIVTGGWNTYNPDHAIEKEKEDPGGCAPPFGWCGTHTIVFRKYSTDFFRVWKNGITCTCESPYK